MTGDRGDPFRGYCRSCGRPLAREERGDDHRVWCSRRCRSRRIAPVDRELERTLLALLEQRAAGASLCPSEAARSVRGADWRPLVEPARRAGRRLALRGLVEFTQGGRAVDPARAKGPVRIRRVRHPSGRSHHPSSRSTRARRRG